MTDTKKPSPIQTIALTASNAVRDIFHGHADPQDPYKVNFPGFNSAVIVEPWDIYSTAVVFFIENPVEGGRPVKTQLATIIDRGDGKVALQACTTALQTKLASHFPGSEPRKLVTVRPTPRSLGNILGRLRADVLASLKLVM